MQSRFTRREVIGAGAAAFALPALGLSLPVAAGPRLPAVVPFRVIYDERFEAGLRYAADTRACGWVTRAIRGDVTNVWFHDLAVRWKQGPAPIAGLTTEHSLFVLERLAWDVGMRVTGRETDATTNLVAWQISVPTRTSRSA